MLDHIRPVSPSLEYGFVPEEIFRALTCASSSLGSPDYLQSHQKTKNIAGFRVSASIFCFLLSRIDSFLGAHLHSVGEREGCQPC